MSDRSRLVDATRLRRYTRAFAWLAIAIVIPLYAVKVHQKVDYTDFDVYFKAATRAKAGQWTEIYNLGDGASPFRYAPILLPIVRLAASVPLGVSKLLWYALQVLFFALGFRWIHRSLGLVSRVRKSRGESFITAVSFLFILRFCLDTFTIGQVSSFLFAGLCLGLWGWMRMRPGVAGAGVFFPAAFKIGPGFQYLLLATGRARLKLKPAVLATLGLLVSLTALLWVYVGSLATALQLGRDWVRIVAADSAYYDASHYGSQSLKSALLRLANHGWLTPANVSEIHLFSLFWGCAGVAAFWAMRRPKGMLGRGLFYALGMYPYLWFMPETFKYALTVLAIPVAFLLASPPSRLTRAAIAVGALTLSLAGKDLIGDALFFGMQKASLPFLGTVLLGVATWRQAWRASLPSELYRTIFDARPGAPGPWLAPPPAATVESSLLLPILCGRGSRVDVAALAHWIDAVAREVRPSEILLIPYGEFATRTHPVVTALGGRLGTPHRWIFADPQPEKLLADRGAALRAGFFASHGARIFFGHPEQRVHAPFFRQAAETLDREPRGLILANRRLPESRFVIPVKLLPLIFGRHRLGLLFNRFVRLWLPIRVTDTQSGSCALPRGLASELFALQVTEGFLFDLELVLVARAQGYAVRELAVSTAMTEEKSPARILREVLAIATGLPGLALRQRKGYYAALAATPDAISADDWGLSPGINEGILELARLGVVRRASLMANCAALTHRLPELRAVPGIKLGLHFNLTYGNRQPFGHGSPGRFLLRALSPFRDRAAWRASVRAELQAQLATLRETGVSVDYFDGHHHIHLVPGLLDAVADILQAHGIREVRLPYDPALWTTGKFPLNLLALWARRAAKRHGFASRPCFYPKHEHFLDPGRLRADLARFRDAEVIVHPARFDDLDTLEFKDSYTAGRVVEFHALKMLATASSGAES
jgi:predicted glycoside hydrolase/deacetylase ChbG (UPF0249 family)